MAAWFELPNQGDDPPSYFFSEGSQENVVVPEGRFTEVLPNDMRGLAQVLPRLHGG
jgi:hypothetical protein